MKLSHFIRNQFPLLISLLGGIAGAILMIYITRWGPWAFTDSVSYVEAARNLATGEPFAEIRATGTIIPFDKQPPLYPWLLALGHKLGLSLVTTARWIDVLAFGLLVFTAGMLVSRKSDRPWLPPLAMLLILPSPLLLEASSGVMTEALFLMLSLAGLALLAIFLSRRRPAHLIGSALAISLCALTRYAGMAPIATGLVAILLINSTDLKSRLKHASVFGLITMLPLAIWVFSRLGAASQVSAQLMSHLENPWQILEILRVEEATIIWSWLPVLGSMSDVAYRVKLIVEVLLGLTLLAVNVGLYLRPGREPLPRRQRITALILLLQVTFHTLFMVGVTLFGPWEVRIDSRQLTPIFLFGGLGLLLSLDFGYRSNYRRWASFSLQLILVATLVWQNFGETRYFIDELHTHGRGYTASAWHGSELLQAVENLPAGTLIITNDIEGLMFHTGISAYRFTEIQEDIALPIDEPYGVRLDDPLQILYAQDCAAIVLFEDEVRLFQEVYGSQARVRMQSMVSESYTYHRSEQGGIYFFDEPCTD